MLERVCDLEDRSQNNSFLSAEPAIVNALRECIAETAQSWRMGGFPVGVVATSNDTSRIPTSILSSFKHQLEFEVRQQLR